VPIENGALAPRLEQRPFELYRGLTPAEQALLIDRAKSVARIEVEVGSDSVSRGTGFVIGRDLLATNCHVVAAIASRDTDGRWKLGAGKVRAHFADGPEHDRAREFTVIEVVAYPDTLGLDVAVLRVESMSQDKSMALPKPLSVRTQPLSPTWAPESGLPIAVIGYPVVASSREPSYRELSTYGRFGKVYSPGAVMELKTLSNLAILMHVASTTEGSSGSPVLAVDRFDVIGVHNCCTSTAPSRPVELSCSQTLQAPVDRNLAIAAPNLFSDNQISKFFQTTP
jgi:V8-like Glu-specific endopeptidase